MNSKIALLIILFLSLAGTASAQPAITLQSFSTGYNRPVAIEHCGDSRLFVVQQRGLIIISDSLGNRLSTPFLNLSGIVSQSGNERGLLGLAFHPNYATNGYFYVNYTAESNGNTYIARYTRNTSNPNLADPSSQVILMTITQPYSNHNGGNLEFGPDGYLYIGMGDGGSGGDPENYAQTSSSLLGKMLRIDIDNGSPYSIPPSNPFVDSTPFAPAIWALGLRNPWRFSFDQLTGDMWIGDVGQGNWEEIDFEPAGSAGGLNYGWKCYEGNATYSSGSCGTVTTHTGPVFVYDNDALGCSVTGGIVYRGAQFNNMYGYYLFADYCSGRFWTTLRNVSLNTFNTTAIKDTTDYQYSAFGEDRYGELYVTALGEGRIYKIRSTQCAPVALIQNNAPTTICEGDNYVLQAKRGAGLNYQWIWNGLDIPGATQPDYATTITGSYTVRVSKAAVGCSTTSAPVNITVKNRPDPVIAGSSEICDDASVSHLYSVSPTSGHSYEWSISSGDGTIINGQGTHQITVVWNSGTAGTVQVVQTNP